MDEDVYKYTIVLLVIIVIVLAINKLEIKQVNPVREIVVEESNQEDIQETIREELRRHDRLYGPIVPR